MRILLRVCYDMRRQRNRETPCAMGLFAADVDGSGVWWEPSAGQMLAGAGVRRDPGRDEALDVRDAIASLSADDRLVLGLFISGEPAEVEASLDIAYHYLSIMSVCLPILYMLHIYRSALMGLGDTVVPMFSGVAEMVVRIGVALLLPLVMGQEGIYYAEVGAWTAAAILLVAAYYARMRALSRRKGFALDEKN